MPDQTQGTGSRPSPKTKDRLPLHPFVRASAITEASIYWLPVRQFTVPFMQREWMLKFLERLSAAFSAQDLLPETLLQLKYTRQELNKRFTQTLMEYEPVTGLLLEPGAAMPAAPTSLEIKKLVDAPNSQAEINIAHLSPNYCAWFLTKNGSAQRRDFLGVGGMMLLWTRGDPQSRPQALHLSKALTSHPGFAAHDFAAQLQKLHSMQAPWLKQSKQVFGASIQDDALFQGVPFILPKLDAAAFTNAQPEQLAAWFSVFHACFVESEKDTGMLLAVADPEFDVTLQSILDDLEKDDLEYPS